MSEEILINITPMETRIALIENRLLQEIFIERRNSGGRVGSIYHGQVVRVMPGMDAAFVDIGLGKAGFIHALDISPIAEGGFEVREDPHRGIEALVREGQFLVVQVVKDAISTKGARLSTHLTLPSRNLVFLPRGQHLRISQSLQGEEERSRLMTVLEQCLVDEGKTLLDRGGYIIRTAAEGVTAAEIREDIRYLSRLWGKVEKRIVKSGTIKTVHNEVPLYIRVIRDFITPRVEKIRVDNKQLCDEITQFSGGCVPDLKVDVELYLEDRPIFDIYGIEDEINKALDRKVKLKSGGDLIIDQTEAMTTIDVNTAGYLGSSNQAETILKINLEAAVEIARQLRVRNLGGIVIVDFIDMTELDHQRQVQQTFNKALEKDHARTATTDLSPIGLIEMTRKRTRESLGQVVNDPCIVCAGRGRQKSAETVCCEIFREMLRVVNTCENDMLLVIASQIIVDRLLDEEFTGLTELEELVGKTVKFEVEPMYTQEEFDVVLS